MSNEHKHCRNCDADLDGGSVWQTFFDKTGSEDEADRISAMYGATRTTGRWGREIGISDMHLDMIVEWKCPDCGYTWSRFSKCL